MTPITSLRKEAEPSTYPATFIVHWATGPTPCCVKHAHALINLGRMLGTHVQPTGAAEGDQCANCINEAKADATRDAIKAAIR